MATSEELGLHFSASGFKHFPRIESVYGGEIRVYESSSAEEPRVWVRIECPADFNHPSGETLEAVAHLNLVGAKRLADQINYLVEHHYQIVS